MIGKRLTILREEQNLKQKDLAEILKLAPSTISAYEREISEPEDEIKKQIATYFNVSVDYLIGLTDIKLSLKRTDIIHLPKDFPDTLIPKVEDYIAVLYKSHIADENK